nr:hypothetical protein [Tanacetum cinerariifolium]
MDMFRDTLHLPVETPDNPFIAPVNIKVIKSFMQRVGYQGVVDKEYETVFVGVEVPMNQPQLVVSTQRTHRTTPRDHWTPTLTAASPQGKKRKQVSRETKKMVKGEEDEESYASRFANSMLNDDDDFENKIEPRSHKEYPEHVNDEDDETKKEKKDDTKDDKKDDDMQTRIPTPDRSPRKELSSDKTISKELTATVAPTTATTSKDSSKSKSKRGFTSNKTKILPEALLACAGDVVKFAPILKQNFSYTYEPFACHDEHHMDVDPFGGGKKAKRVNLTAPTLTFPGIKAHEPYSIVDKPNTGLIYLTNKDEKWVMFIVEIVKFCDATLERVLNEVKLRIFQNHFWKKPPRLDELDLDIMKAFEREITKHLRHRQQMRRWESFMNGRPTLPAMTRL